MAPRTLTHRFAFGALGAVLLGGVGISILVHENDDDAASPSQASDQQQGRPGNGVGRPPRGDDEPEHVAPDSDTTDPYAIDPALDEGPDPGDMTAEMVARVDDAVQAAAQEGVELTVTSGWRSYAHQEELFSEAVQKHGSEAVAREWVLPPDESMHVRGLAVDVGPPEGASWLEENGWRFGLCRRYDNEPWHFEPITEPGGSCPARQPSAAD